MEIGHKGPLDATLSQLVKDNQPVSPVREKGGKGVERSQEATQVNISSEAQQLQKVAALAELGDQLRAEKVNQIKEQVSRGEYHVEAADVAKGIVRSEISSLLSKTTGG